MAVTTTMGNLGSGLADQEGNNYRLGFYRARGMDNDPTLDILRYTWSGQDLAAAVQGTAALVADLDSLPCLVRDFTRAIAESMGEDFEAGQKVFETIPASAAEWVQDGDFIAWDSKRWKPVSIHRDDGKGVCVVVARREED